VLVQITELDPLGRIGDYSRWRAGVTRVVYNQAEGVHLQTPDPGDCHAPLLL
jgi:hypothetical protein